MNKIEAKKTSVLMKWLKSDQCPLITCAIEVKIVRGKTYYASQLKEHQYRALDIVKKNKLVHKIPDTGYQNPFDIFILRQEHAYVCLIVKNMAYILNYQECGKNLDIESIQKLAYFSVKV